MDRIPDFRRIEPPAYVDAITVAALEDAASDIYWIPGAESCSVRFKVNGVQREVDTVPAEYGVQCVTRLKVLGGMLTYRSRVAQDGVFRRDGVRGRAEFRVASMPTLHGERLTIRILDSGRRGGAIADLGLLPEEENFLRDILDGESGMIVLTGPTGCGKTTTIYAMIRELLLRNQDPASIIAIEDPVECEIPGITQTAVRSDADDWGYAAALRSALRQDVKTLVIGEMRDREVVRVALEAALTGHRVITTYHAGDIAGVFIRLLHQGFEPFLVAGAVAAVAAQRLVPAADGHSRVPVLAGIRPDDAFRDFLIGAPDLAGIRSRLAAVPFADLAARMKALFQSGRIGPAGMLAEASTE